MAKARIDELWWARVAKQEGLHVGKYYRQYHQRRRTVEDVLYWNLKSIEARCKKKGIPFNISIEDLEIPSICPILKKPFDLGIRQNYTPSIDKVIPELGYVKGNVRVISRLANQMKSSATYEELEAFSKNILQYMGDEIGN